VLAANTVLVAAGASVNIRNPALPDPPEFPDDIEASDSPIVSVGSLGETATLDIAMGTWGPRVRLAVQVLIYTGMQHGSTYVNLSNYVTEVCRTLRDQHGTTSAVYSPDDRRQGLVEITEVSPVTKHPHDICWMQQTVFATVTIIGD
jgi:hypothetical protein